MLVMNYEWILRWICDSLFNFVQKKSFFRFASEFHISHSFNSMYNFHFVNFHLSSSVYSLMKNSCIHNSLFPFAFKILNNNQIETIEYRMLSTIAFVKTWARKKIRIIHWSCIRAKSKKFYHSLKSIHKTMWNL